jgi:hypothetical protein
MASYSAMLLVHLSVSLVKWSLDAYRNLILKGDTKIATAPAPVLAQAPSQFTSQGDSCVLSST